VKTNIIIIPKHKILQKINEKNNLSLKLT
jgi:hypothetical protein